MSRPARHPEAGLTLVEMLVALALFAVIAAVAEVGNPSVSSGTSVPAAEALLAASGPATPSMAPRPNSSGCRESRRSST